jgi:hypothetical protein
MSAPNQYAPLSPRNDAVKKRGEEADRVPSCSSTVEAAAASRSSTALEAPLTHSPPRPLTCHLARRSSSPNGPLPTVASSSPGHSCSGDSRLFPVSSKVCPHCPALDPCLCLSSFLIVQVFPDAAVSLPPVILQVFLDCGTSCVD